MTAVVSISLLLVLTLIFIEEVKGARAGYQSDRYKFSPLNF